MAAKDTSCAGRGSARRLLWLAVALTGLALGQAPGEIRASSGPYVLSPTLITTQVNTVPLTVVVRDQQGKAIGGLSQQRFRVSEEGAPQVVTSFQVETTPAAVATAVAARNGAGTTPPAPVSAAVSAAAAPRYVALLFDDVNSNRNDLAEARNAAMRFLREQLGPGDHMAVFTISGSPTLGFTGNRKALTSVIAGIAPHPRNNMGEGCPPISPYDAYLIAVLHDQAVEEAKGQEAAACGLGGGLFGGAAAYTRDGEPDRVAQKRGFAAEGPVGSGSGGSGLEVEAEADWEEARGAVSATLSAVRRVVNYTARQPGERIVVLASSGFFAGTLEDQVDGIIRDALGGGVVINALDAKGLYTEGPEPPLSAQSAGALPLAAYIFEEANRFPEREAQADAMASIAAATGGLYFRNNNDLTLGFERLGLAPRMEYDLAFSPDPFPRDGKLHNIHVELAPPISGATIEARRGFFAPVGLTAMEAQRNLDQAMRGSATASAIPAAVSEEQKPGGLQVRVHVGVTGRNEKLRLVAGLFDANGRFATGEQAELQLALGSTTYGRLRKSGLGTAFVLHAPAGRYRLRVVVLDEIGGALSEFNRPVQAH